MILSDHKSYTFYIMFIIPSGLYHTRSREVEVYLTTYDIKLVGMYSVSFLNCDIVILAEMMNGFGVITRSFSLAEVKNR